jgi:Calcineurin-like phosphoesterase
MLTGHRLPRTLIGIGLIGISVVALAAPFAAGRWSLQFLGLFPLAVGLADLYATISNPQLATRPSAYATGIVAVAVALLLYLSPSMVLTGIIALLLALLVIDAALKIGQALFVTAPGTPRAVTLVNGAASLLLALVGWTLWRKVGVEAAIGVAIAGYTAAAGWRMLVSPAPQRDVPGAPEATNSHPDVKLGLGPQELFGVTSARFSTSVPAVRQVEIYWLLVAGLALLTVHVARMQSYDTWLGLVSPIVATAGDVFMAIMLGAFLVLPLRLSWRQVTRPLERKVWRLRIAGHDMQMNALPRRLLQEWTDARFSFSASLSRARVSLPLAAGLLIRLGLPLAILFVAVNPIWGFSWYFNTESWASAFYQKITELRVDTWRAAMVDAVVAAYGGNREGLFSVTPPGTENQDFSFIVIGDTGEGDASQYSLVERYLELGRREDIKFLVISSDVIYPAGAMVDYENNFYLPFKGFTKPIYAIPGNHDWFDALEGFNANFLEPKAAQAALAARVEADHNLTSTTKGRIEHLIARAQQLRELYAIDNARQRAPFFELQTKDFALVAIDTGILRTIDDTQLAWLKAVLNRSQGKFTMAIVGHPKYAAGHDTSKGDDALAALYAMLEQAGVRVLMAGDTHDFEYYAEVAADGAATRTRHYFVNGGGGAYLSIGTALDWPTSPATASWAFYPDPQSVRAKLDAETPAWKLPFWLWVRRFGAWPLSSETLSGMFDFNHAPFFQSFMEVRVEASKARVVLLLHGVNGPLKWRDLSTSATPIPGQAGADDPVQFVIPFDHASVPAR